MAYEEFDDSPRLDSGLGGKEDGALSGALAFLSRFGVWFLLVPLLVPLLFFVHYLVFETTEFPELEPSLQIRLQGGAELTVPEKGQVLSYAIRHRLEQEMKSTYGWSVNDLLISPTSWLDNRANRQEGVIFATKLLARFLATDLGKLGKGGEEHKALKAARDTHFVFQPTKWWLPSSESQYRDGIKALKKYEGDLKNGGAVFNLRSDDLYTLLVYITSEEFLGEPLGRLSQHNTEVSYFKLDDHIYYTQGVVLVLRDFIQAVVAVYPEYLEKGGRENFESAQKDMNLISTFNPLIVLGAEHDSVMPDHRAKVHKYLFTLIERLDNVAQSIRR